MKYRLWSLWNTCRSNYYKYNHFMMTLDPDTMQINSVWRKLGEIHMMASLRYVLIQ